MSSNAARKTKNKLLELRAHTQSKNDLSIQCIDVDVEFAIPVSTSITTSSDNVNIAMGSGIFSIKDLIHDSGTFYDRISSLIKYHYDQTLDPSDIKGVDTSFPKNFLLQELSMKDLQLVRKNKQHQGLFKLGATLAMPFYKHISTPLDDYVTKDGIIYRKLFDEDRDRSYMAPHRHEIVHSFSSQSTHQSESLITPQSSLEIPLIFPSDISDSDGLIEEPPLSRRGHTTHYFNPETGRFIGDSTSLTLESGDFNNEALNPSCAPRYKALRSTAKNKNEEGSKSVPSVLLGYDSYAYPYFANQNDACHYDDSDDEIENENGETLKKPKFSVDLSNYVKFANGLRYKIAEARCGDLEKWQMVCDFQDYWYTNPVKAIVGRMQLRIIPLVPRMENTHLIPYHNQLSHIGRLLKEEALNA